MVIKLGPNLTKNTVERSDFQRMKVSSAMHLFSNSTSSWIRFLVKEMGRNAEYLTTAWFLDICNRWFDLMSSRHPVMDLNRENSEKYKEAVDFLNSVIKLFSELKIGKPGHWKPVQTGVIMSTTSVINLQNELLDNGLQFLLKSRLTQECLENLLSTIRKKNPTPTALGFNFVA